MPHIEWKDVYSVGNKDLDEQHKVLFDHINRFAEAKKANVSKKEIFVILNSFISYANLHFKTEEAYLKEREYEGYEEQKKEHEDFIKEVFDLNDEFVDGDSDIYYKILEFTEEWLIAHVLGTDKLYKFLFAEKSLK